MQFLLWRDSSLVSFTWEKLCHVSGLWHMIPFLVHFPNFWGKNFFPENPALSRTTSYEFLAPCQNLEKTNDAILRKRPDRQKDRRTDGQNLFYKTLPTTARGPIKRLSKFRERLHCFWFMLPFPFLFTDFEFFS